MSARKQVEWTRESLQARVDRAPFNRVAGTRGGELGTRRASNCVCAPAPRSWATSPSARCTGESSASVLDTACSIAVVTATGESVFTVDMRVDYLRPATAEVYTIRARVVRLGRSLATVDAEVEAADGQKVACGRAVLQNIAQMQAASGST